PRPTAAKLLGSNRRGSGYGVGHAAASISASVVISPASTCAFRCRASWWQASAWATSARCSASGLRTHGGEHRPSTVVPDVQAAVVFVEYDSDLRPGFVELPEVALGNVAGKVVVLSCPCSRCASAHDMQVAVVRGARRGGLAHVDDRRLQQRVYHVEREVQASGRVLRVFRNVGNAGVWGRHQIVTSMCGPSPVIWLRCWTRTVTGPLNDDSDVVSAFAVVSCVCVMMPSVSVTR